MKLSKLIEILQSYKETFKYDPDVCVRTSNFEDENIEDFCTVISSDKEYLYLVILGSEEADHFRKINDLHISDI